MRIAFVSTMDGAPWGGSELLWAEAAKAALNDGHEVMVFVYRWPTQPAMLTAIEKLGAKIVVRPVVKGGRRAQIRRAIRGNPFRFLADFRPDVVCVSQGGSYELAWIPDGRDLRQVVKAGRFRTVAICQAHDESLRISDEARQEAIAAFQQTSAVLFVAERNRLSVERQLAWKLPAARVVRNPVNPAVDGIVPFPTPSSTARFAAVGRLHVASKGQDLLLEALASSMWRGRDWRLCIYGEGCDNTYLRDLAKHYGLSDRIEFRGYEADVRRIWRENEMLVMPSRYEGTPLALVEAMLCGRPSVVTDVGGNAEWVEEGRTGFVAEATTAFSLGLSLDRAWATRADWSTLGLAANSRAKELVDTAPGRTVLRLLLAVADGTFDETVAM